MPSEETKASEPVTSFKDEILLKQICKCKGSLKYVHESCLVKWLITKNTKYCELCLQPYDITYEYGSFREICSSAVNYLNQDKRRLLRGLLYALYLWIFFRRFLYMIHSIFKFIKNSFSNLLQTPSEASEMLKEKKVSDGLNLS